MTNPELISLLKDPELLIPAIVQDVNTREVLMLAYMNTQSLAMTLSSGRATYWSRSRNELWVKGATSGHFQQVHSISLDCDGDALLVTVTQTGVACHTGEVTCFHKPLPMSAL
ncbi:MAG: phosphoribosyl-AMP cyclohydrolase [Actinobacteria bacterium]|uniref:Histidine biosynthesis bifunctional protein HisIE n=1 Tax=freshwater metagenome TaxID=449393 RepID=A0A6J7CPH3_9ZZZZ|nr:phosphoribosyl-AMP cyclohydrolase [Actinomycetota bacterium]